MKVTITFSDINADQATELLSLASSIDNSESNSHEVTKQVRLASTGDHNLVGSTGNHNQVGSAEHNQQQDSTGAPASQQALKDAFTKAREDHGSEFVHGVVAKFVPGSFKSAARALSKLEIKSYGPAIELFKQGPVEKVATPEPSVFAEMDELDQLDQLDELDATDDKNEDGDVAFVGSVFGDDDFNTPTVATMPYSGENLERALTSWAQAETVADVQVLMRNHGFARLANIRKLAEANTEAGNKKLKTLYDAVADVYKVATNA